MRATFTPCAKGVLMLSDVEIARNANPRPISEIAEKLGYSADEIESYGKFKAKVPLKEGDRHAKLVLVTAMNPTPLGEGKTTVSISLADGMRRVGLNACLALREPSLGPVFGIKGGACGGGYAQIIPMEDINLHFTGDFHAITSANNLLSALIDNHIRFGNALGIKEVIWRRCLDLNDRALRVVEVGLGGTANGVPRTDGFVITAASEIMAVLCLASSLEDLKRRLGNIVIGYDEKGNEVCARALHAEESMTVLLRDALRPNLVQTLEGTPAYVHGGPFANIAHGCNSILATRAALTHSDYVVTEAGFGAELGGEKFIDIKCRKAGIAPDCVVLVVTARSLKFNGGVSKDKAAEENVAALKKGFANVKRHLNNLKMFGQHVVVAINRFAADTEKELETLSSLCRENGAEAVLCEGFAKGGAGAEELARKVAEVCASSDNTIIFAYSRTDSVKEKIEAVAKKVYGAAGVSYSPLALEHLAKIEANPVYAEYPICMAKTQYSFSCDEKALGAPEGFDFEVRDIIPRAGAEFIVVIGGNMLLMPGLGASPNTERISIDTETGEISGLM